MKVPVTEGDREKLLAIAGTSLRTKVHHKIASLLTEVCRKFMNIVIGIEFYYIVYSFVSDLR